MAEKKLKIALIIPAYNEAVMIGSVVKGLVDAFDGSDYDYEIIVVDDGSTDDTAVQAQHPRVRVIRHILNSGSGGATATGLSYAQQQNFFAATTCDADGQHDPVDVLRGVDELIARGSDLLIGSRLIDRRGMSRVKVLGNRGLSLITYTLFGVNITDSQSGLRIFSRRALERLKWKTQGYEYCSEMLWRAKQLDLKLEEYPIRAIYTEYSKGKGQNNWNAFNIIKTLLQRRIVELFSE